PAPFGWRSFVFRATPQARTASNVSFGSASRPCSSAARPAVRTSNSTGTATASNSRRTDASWSSPIPPPCTNTTFRIHHPLGHFAAASGYPRATARRGGPMTAIYPYDAVDYPSAALPEAHPSHLFAVASMFGMDPAPVDRCRYLEVGCGDGTHLIACAV